MSATLSGLVVATFTGKNGAGAISVTGLKAGDLVLGVWSIETPATYDAAYTAANGTSSPWEAVITVDDQIQQVVGNDLSAQSLKIVLFRGP